MTVSQLRRAGSLLEVIGVYSAGPLVGYLLRQALGISVTNPLATLRADSTNSELVRASLNMFVLFLFQYPGTFLLIVPLNWWYRRRGLASYGITKANRSWAALLLSGLATAALATWPAMSASLLNSIYPSETAPWRQALLDMSWLRWQFWLFTAVMSWALVPFFEELFYRGYCQRRLAEDWGNGPAIIATSCLFTFAHIQYQIPNAYNFGMILSLIVLAIGFGVVFAWTGSIVPSFIAHAIINIPMTLSWQAATLILLLIGASIAWRPGVAALRKTFHGASPPLCIVLGIAFGAYSAASARLEMAAAIVAAALLIIALVLEGIDKYRTNPIADARRASERAS
jgi:membrane protease YdiL (CAAX protease family)